MGKGSKHLTLPTGVLKKLRKGVGSLSVMEENEWYELSCKKTERRKSWVKVQNTD